MPFREKTAWISLFASLSIYGSYFASGGMASFGAMVGATVLFVLVMIVLTVAVAIFARRSGDASRPADERERLIALKSSRATLVIVTTGALGAIAAMFWGADRVLVANGLFFALVLGEVAKDLAQIVYFRRGI